MTARRESAIVQRILAWLNSQPMCVAEKHHGSPYSPKGHADIAGVFHGQALALEVKRPGEKPTILQEKYLQKWASAGAITGVVTSVEEVRELLNG